MSHRPTVTLSQTAARLYSSMFAHADEDGHLDLDSCLEVSVRVGARSEMIQELEAKHLIFNSPETSGWFVRHPPRRILVEDPAGKIDS